MGALGGRRPIRAHDRGFDVDHHEDQMNERTNVHDTEPAPASAEALHSHALVIEVGKAWNAYSDAYSRFVEDYPETEHGPQTHGEEWERRVTGPLHAYLDADRQLKEWAKEISK